jgi:hypothetical protein
MLYLELLGLGGNLNGEESKIESAHDNVAKVEDTIVNETKPIKRIVVHTTGMNGKTMSLHANLLTEKKASRNDMDEYSSSSRQYSIVKGHINQFDREMHVDRKDMLAECLSLMKENPKFTFELLRSIPAELMVKVMIANGVDIQCLLPSPIESRVNPLK